MSDIYIELEVFANSEFIDLLADFISTITNEAVEITESSVILRTTNDTTLLESELNKLKESIDLYYTKEKKQNIDWISKYKESIAPIEVGDFWVYPSWYEPKEDKINILINPALAFGSGHHATTYTTLEQISKFVKKGDTLLDVGCGSGILALAAAKLGAVVDLCDTDPLAIDSAKENFELNKEEYRDIWVGSANKSSKKYDIVVANIIADVLKMISSELKNRLNSGSILIVSGILDKKENIVTDAFLDLDLIERNQKDEWVTLTYKKR